MIDLNRILKLPLSKVTMDNEQGNHCGQKPAYQKSERGAALISAIAGVGLLSMAMFSSMAYIDFLTTQNASIKRDFSVSLVKSNILRTLQSPTAWTNTVNDDANLFKDCQLDPVNCLAISNYVPLKIHDIENNVLIAGTQGSWYNYAGQLCTGEACPVLVKSQWRGICNSEGTCTQAYVELDFQIREKDGTQSKSKVGFLKNYFIGTAKKSLTTSVTFTSGDVSNATAKIIVILDSSESMVDNFAKVKTGLSGIMAKLAGKDVEVYFYTTASLEPNVNINYSATTPLKVYHESTTYNDFKKVASFVVSKDDDITYNMRLAMDMSRKISSPIEPTLDATTILSRLDSVFATYVAAYGTNIESGLCTLHRILMDEGPNKIIGSNDLAFFIIVSDEDDMMLNSASLKYACNKSQKIELVTDTSNSHLPCDPSIETCDMANARLVFSGTQATIYYTVKTNDTSTPWARSVCSVNTNSSAPGYVPCPFETIGNFPCSAKELNVINPDGSKNITACYINVSIGSVSNTVSSENKETMASLQTNFCTGGPFTLSLVNYLNLKDYITRYFKSGYDSATLMSCQVSFVKFVPTETSSYKATSYTRMNGEVTTTNLYDSDDRLKIQDHIITTLKTKFGETGFGVKAFIQDPIKDLGLCALTDGAYGTAYKDLINNLYNNPYSGYESICNDTYNFSFETLGNNILSTMNNTYIFNNLASTDKITGISITRAGSSFTMSPDKYEIVGSKVIFQEGALQTSDQITLILADQTSGTWGP